MNRVSEFSNWMYVGNVSDVGSIVDNLHLHSLVPMTEEDRAAYLAKMLVIPEHYTGDNRKEMETGSLRFNSYTVDPVTEGDPRLATHWLIDITVPEDIEEYDEEERKDITWWDMSIWSVCIEDGEIYGYAPEFNYSWWQATYREKQVHDIADAMRDLAVNGTLVNDHDRVWSEVWNSSKYHTPKYVDFVSGK